MTLPFTVSEEDQGKRLDLFISEKLKLSRAKAQQLIEADRVLVNGKIKQKSYKLQKNDEVQVDESSLEEEKSPEVIIPQNIPLEILYKDEHIVAISKPPGMVVYPSLGHPDGTVINALAYHQKKLASVGGPLRPGVVHRLDKDTSGVLLVALTDEAYYRLVEMFKKREISKYYIAIAFGNLYGRGKIELPIGRAIGDRKKMSTKSKRSKEAITEWEVLENFSEHTLLRLKIITGRTHQIRVHLSSIGHPILGDSTYGRKVYLEIGKKRIPIRRQMLHAHRLTLPHPITGEELSIEAPLPSDMNELISILREDSKKTSKS